MPSNPKPPPPPCLFQNKMHDAADNDRAGRAYIKSLMEDAGLDVSEDPMGSIFGTWKDGVTDPLAAAVGTGSHCDAIPLAGAYDGTLGVVGGIAALKALRSSGFRPNRPLQVIMFTSEEPTRFGLSCLGSRAMAGALNVETLSKLRDVNGTGFMAAAHEAGSAAGFETEAAVLEASRLTTKELSAFVELHIEQGPELEAEELQLGVVTAIAAPAALRVTFQGDGGHAGALLMPRRNDASLAAAELALRIEASAKGTGALDTVATAGRWEVSPNAVNSVPRIAALEIDVRDVNGTRRDAVLDDIKKDAEAIAASRKCRVEVEQLSLDPPATSASNVVDAVESAAKQLGASFKHMPSRAYHDSLFMAQIAPTGMIFIPCAGGYSHRPDEHASPEDIELGVRALAGAMAKLAGGSLARSGDGCTNEAARDEL
jgi:ureidoglycolate amidohydrolase